MSMYIFPIYKHYIKHPAILRCLHNSPMVKNRNIRTVTFSQMKINIVIFIAAVDLFPDACFYLLLLIFADQIAKPFLSKSE